MTNASKKSTVRLLKDLKKRFQTKGWNRFHFEHPTDGSCCLVGGVRKVCGLPPEQYQYETAKSRPAVRLFKALYAVLPKVAFSNDLMSQADHLIAFNDSHTAGEEDIYSLIDRAIANELAR